MPCQQFVSVLRQVYLLDFCPAGFCGEFITIGDFCQFSLSGDVTNTMEVITKKTIENKGKQFEGGKRLNRRELFLVLC